MAKTQISSTLLACADEPIRVPGAVQPHGFFLLTDEAVQSIVLASENAADFLGVPLKLILGAKLDTILERELLTAIEAVLKGVFATCATTYLGSYRIGGELCSVMTHCIGERRALEFERVDTLVGPEMMNAVVTNFVATLSRIPSRQQLCDEVTQQVHSLTGYDRVMLYSFDEEGNGTVISEASNGRLPSYRDLRFPATDIPAQARALYLENTIRIIPDADYEPSQLVAIAGGDAAGLDLSSSILRSVSPVHLQYMRNMGTLSSMSISIIVDGKLWGLISGHHSQPKTVPYLIRSACDMLAKLTSTQLLSQRANERLKQTVAFHTVQRELLTQLAVEPNYLVSLRGHMSELMQVANATGVALLLEDGVETLGTVPGVEEIGRLGAWLEEQNNLDAFHTNELGRELPWAEEIREHASGLLAVRISQIRRRYVLWFRPEIVQTVQWAGELPKGNEPKVLSPRTSFESWKQIVRGRSVPWSEMEVESALDFRAALTVIGLQRAEEAFELSEARFQQLTAALPARVFTCDDDGTLTFVNRRWHAQGLRAAGKWFEDGLFSEEDHHRLAALWKQSVETNSVFETEVKMADPVNGGDRWNFVRSIPFHREGASRAGWIGTFIDLTDAKEREQALRIADKLAMTGRMTSVIAHEINNPLESITNLLFLLRNEISNSGPAMSYITMAESELHRISGVTKQTLRWNRETPDVEDSFVAGITVDEVLRLFTGKIRNREIYVAVRGDRETKLYGVIGKIRQVLANLVSNALDAAPVGGKVTIEFLSTAERNGFRVTDNGAGMSDEVRRRLFEPFFSTKGDLGNGLGLYISKEIVERHGGALQVESIQGKGTTATVMLPKVPQAK